MISLGDTVHVVIKKKIKHFVCMRSYKAFLFYSFLRKKHINVENVETSLKIIRDRHLSIGRYGDGEFKWMFEQREADNFEKNSHELAQALRNILNTNREDFKVCIPDIFNGLEQYDYVSQTFWAGQLGKHGYKWLTTLNGKYEYLDSLITRPYMIYENKGRGKRLFEMFKDLWREKDVLIVEGSETRFGVGNDLLSSSKSVSRIICPATNAFESYDKILKQVSHYTDSVNNENLLVLVSLGPTATVLSYDLSFRGIQVLDIGHLDIEYSWFLMHTTKKTKVPYKYVNEVSGGNEVLELPKQVAKEYRMQIVKKIE